MAKTLDELKVAKKLAEGKIDGILHQLVYDFDLKNLDVRVNTTTLHSVGKPAFLVAETEIKVEL